MPSDLTGIGESVRPARRKTRRPQRKRRAVIRAFAAAVLLFVIVIGGLYGRAMLRASSLPLGVRTIEWIRANGGEGLVNHAEHWWYTHHRPKRGGPALTALPAIPALPAPPAVTSVATPTVEPPPRVVLPPRQRPVVRTWRPPRIAPVIVPALPREGMWQPSGRLVAGVAPVLVSVFRPEAAFPRTIAYVGWIDHTRSRLALYPGRYEPPQGSPRGPYQVPQSQRWRLLATFNSGFAYRDGHGGFAVNGRVYEPLRDGLGTIVAYAGGGVDVQTWHGGTGPGGKVVLARQNLPLIVDRGRPNPQLSGGREWGATLGNAVQVWRSAVGVDRHGNLLYAAANYQTVRSLAALMIHVGAVRAIQLDINSEWPSFIAYGPTGGRDPRKIVPNGQQSSSRYLQPDDRDFFAVYIRPGGSATVPFR